MYVVLSGSARAGNPALSVANLLVDQLRGQDQAARCIDLSRLPDDVFGPSVWQHRHAAFVPEERVLIAAPGDRYYLVVPLRTDAEGSHGFDSDGNERPVGLSTCRASQSIGICP